VITDKWGPEYKVVSPENGLKFSQKLGIFPKMSLFLKNGLNFYARFLMQHSIEVSPGYMPSASLIRH